MLSLSSVLYNLEVILFVLKICHGVVVCCLACFILPDDIFQILQLPIVCYETQESVREKKFNSIKCAAAGFF